MFLTVRYLKMQFINRKTVMIFLVRLNAVNQTLQKKSWLGDKDGGRKGRGVRSGAEAGVVSNYHFVYFITALTNGIQK